MGGSDAGGEASVFTAAVHWAVGLLTGSLATSACVLAVAALGGLFLLGKVSIRRGATVIIGCFTILSARGIAEALMVYRQSDMSTTAVTRPPVAPEDAPATRPVAPYDPYGFTAPSR